MWKPWAFGEYGCYAKVATSEAAPFVSVLTMLAFTFERYTAVVYPLRPSLHSGTKRTRKILCAIWFAAIIPGIMWTRYIKYNVLTYFGTRPGPVKDHGLCGIVNNDLDAGAVTLIIATTLILFVIPAGLFPLAYKK